jgi:tol-pal system protein YbgF
MRISMKMVCTAVASCAALLLFGCASTASKPAAEAILPEIDVVQVKENSEEALKISQETKLDVEVINNKLTEIDNKLVTLTEDVSSVSVAKIEEIENRLSLLVEAFKDLQAQVTALQNAPVARTAAAKPAATGPATFSPAAAAGALTSNTEYDSYQNALRVFNARNYEKAQQLFSDLVKQFPSGTYTDNSWYWGGECSYAQNDYAKAVAQFSKVFEFKNSSKADDAQLKIGMCYMKMGQSALAKTEFKKLVDRYPASEYVPRAQKYLSEIK